MDHLDRLGWAAQAALVAYGVRIGVRATGATALETLMTAAPPGSRDASLGAVRRIYSLVVGDDGRARGPRKLHLLYANAELLARARRLPEVVDVFAGDVRRFVAASASRRVFIHSGAVAWGGRAVLLPGASLDGKSRLVAALVAAGATYYSDEYAVLDQAGRVHPFAKPLSLRDEKTAVQSDHAPESFGAVGGAPLAVGAVVLTRYRAGTCFRPRVVPRSQGALGLLAHTIPARRRPEAAMAAVTAAVGSALVLRGARGEAEDAADYLLARLGG